LRGGFNGVKLQRRGQRGKRSTRKRDGREKDRDLMKKRDYKPLAAKTLAKRTKNT